MLGRCRAFFFISKEFNQCIMRNLLEPSDLPEPSDFFHL